MDHIRHPYIFTILGVAVLLVIGILVVENHLPVTSSNRAGDWGTPLPTDVSSYSPSAYTPAARTQPNTQQATPSTLNPQDLSSFSYNPSPAPSAAKTIISTDSSFDFSAFMQQLSGSSSKTPTTQTGTFDTQSIYDPVPSLPPSTTADAAATRSDIQQTLYEYGNEAGSYMQAYEQLHPNDTTVIQNYFKTRNNPANIAAFTQVAADLKNIGTNLKSMKNVPTPVATIHNAFANSYIDMGEKLAALTSPQTNSDIIKAINTYDDAVEVYVKDYNALVLVFSGYGVAFKSDEQGSVFTFNSSL